MAPVRTLPANGASASAETRPAQSVIRERVRESAKVLERLGETGVLDELAAVVDSVVEAYRAGKKVLFFGNGGSAADAQHFAAEMCGRFLMDRQALPAIALVDNVAVLTAIANDYGFEEVFARQVEAVGVHGDVAIGISTSGESENVVRGIESARRGGLITVALTGAAGGRLAEVADFSLCIPSTETPRIQEAHAVVGHILCELVESALFEASA